MSFQGSTDNWPETFQREIMPVFVGLCMLPRALRDRRQSRAVVQSLFTWQEFSVTELTPLIHPLLDLCDRAGQVICGHYQQPGEAAFESKGDNSPVTQADLDSHRILLNGLWGLAEPMPVLSEECSAEELADRRNWTRFWMVDPLDGTKEFIGGTGEFTINIALIEHTRAKLGVLYLPLARQGYVGIPGRGAWCYRRQGDGWQRTSIATRKLAANRPPVVLASRRHAGPRLEHCLAWLRRTRGDFERDNSGSALKFCQMAAGQGDFYPRFSPCSEWDVAAGQALVEAAGGAVLGLDGQPLRYNCRDTLLSPEFLAIAEPGNPLWAQLSEELLS